MDTPPTWLVVHKLRNKFYGGIRKWAFYTTQCNHVVARQSLARFQQDLIFPFQSNTINRIRNVYGWYFVRLIDVVSHKNKRGNLNMRRQSVIAIKTEEKKYKCTYTFTFNISLVSSSICSCGSFPKLSKVDKMALILAIMTWNTFFSINVLFWEEMEFTSYLIKNLHLKKGLQMLTKCCKKNKHNIYEKFHH